MYQRIGTLKPVIGFTVYCKFAGKGYCSTYIVHLPRNETSRVDKVEPMALTIKLVEHFETTRRFGSN